jgi:hypothetical protein
MTRCTLFLVVQRVFFLRLSERDSSGTTERMSIAKCVKVMERIARRERQTLRTRGARKRLPAKRLAQINMLIC